MQIQVISATREQQPIIANLLELYTHDFSEFNHLELGAEGRFGYKDLPLYWGGAEHYPFLFRVEGRLVGFALVERSFESSMTEGGWRMREFFIVRGYRRQKVGMKAAHELWKRLPGRWEVRAMQSNHTAVKFWRRTITIFRGGAMQPDLVEENGKLWYLFAFECKPALPFFGETCNVQISIKE